MINRSFLLLRIPQNNQKKEDVACDFFSQLAEILKGEKIIISAEIVIYNKFLWFFLTCPKTTKDIIKGQWYSQYPTTEIEEIKDYTEKLFFSFDKKYIAGCELRYDQPDLLPIKTYKEIDKNPLVFLSGVANSFTNDESGLIQLVLEPPKKETILDKFFKTIKENRRRKTLVGKEEIPDYIQLQIDKEEKTYFKTTIRFLALGQSAQKTSLNLSSMLAVYKKNLERPKIQKLKEAGITQDKNFLYQFTKRQLGWHRYRFSSEEIATFFHLPHAAQEISQVIQIRSKRAPAPQNLPRLKNREDENIAIFGETNFQNEKLTFGLKTADRRRHLYIIGKTGVGKSKLLEILIKEDLEAGRGIILMDPHGDLAKEVVNLVPENRIDDVVYFDPTDVNFPIGFNPMEDVGSFEFRQNTVAGFISIFKKLFGLNWNERFEHVMRYTTLALLEYPNASVLGITRMLTDNLFRQEVLAFVSDPLVKKFWTTEFASWNEQFSSEAIVPIINKIGQFTANPMIRNIVGQAKSGFSLDDIMNNQKILIANLSIGKLGEENGMLLGSMLVTKIWQTAMSRASISEKERKDVFMFVDEFQNFATNAFGNILSEARKYKLNLTVAHQYMQQLSADIRAALFGNVGNIISFRTGGEDTQILVKEFEPVFNVNDFLNLDLRNFFIKMSIDGQTSKPFSAQTITVESPLSRNFEKIIDLSRKRWARPKEDVEQEIKTWESGKINTHMKPQIEKEFFPEPLI